ncbi:MAG: leucine-rich repeat domain-containing protein [bacterium]|nr:leucine-rich repeat domain-containing protein [Candidatus Limimorpha equi]
MKKSILFLIIAISCAMQSFAYDFPILAPSGQVIYLNIVDSENHTACVTYPCLMSGDNYYYGYDKPTGDLIIPETFTTSSNVTWTIVSIGEHAFDHCTGLTSIEIPNTVTTIGEQAFYHCENATDIKLSESLTTIGEFAFGDCSKWTGTLDIPATIVSIGRSAFNYCKKLSGLSLPNKNVDYGLMCFINCGFEGQLVLPDSLTTIVYEMFRNCNKITDVVFPNTLTTIDDFAFAFCTSLSAIHIPSSTNQISSYNENPFCGCRNLIEITVDENNERFYSENNAIIERESKTLRVGCKTTVIPEDIVSIGEYAFYYVGEGAFPIIPSSVTTLEDYAFSGCEYTDPCVIPNTVTSIGEHAFHFCSFREITIPNSITVIPEGCFRLCQYLKKVIIPETIREIDYLAFSDCSSLSSIYCYAQQPPTIPVSSSMSAFYGVSKSIPVYVPAGSAETYINAPIWEEFTNYIEMPEFAPTHAEWYYEIVNDNGSITYQQLQQEGDTVINHKDVKIIVRTNTLYDKHQEITHEYVYEENNVVYWWNKTLNEFTTLYDFAAETGDEWQIKAGMGTITLHVDAVELVEYDGRTYKVLKVSDEGDLFSGNIVCGIGHVASFFPEKLMQKALPFDVESLRCYWVNDNLILHMGTVDCDEILTVEENVSAQDSESIALYPNPTNGTLYIESQGDASIFSISNMLGQTVMTGNIADNQTIDVSRLDDGMYFICVGQQTVKFVVRK